MHLISDNRKKRNDDDNEDEDDLDPTPKALPFEPGSEATSISDSDAMKLKGQNPLAEEESVEADDTGDS